MSVWTGYTGAPCKELRRLQAGACGKRECQLEKGNKCGSKDFHVQDFDPGIHVNLLLSMKSSTGMEISVKISSIAYFSHGYLFLSKNK